MRRVGPYLYLIVPLGMLVALLVLHLRQPALFDGLRLQVFDAYQRLRPRPYTPLPVRIIDIDEQSLARLGQWPWPRTRLAKLVDRARAAGAAVVVFDFLLAEPDRTSPARAMQSWTGAGLTRRLRGILSNLPDHDTILARAIARGKVVAGFVLTQDGGGARPRHDWRIRHAWSG